MTRKELRDYVDEQRTLNNIPYHVYSTLIDGIDTLEQEPRKGRWINKYHADEDGLDESCSAECSSCHKRSNGYAREDGYGLKFMYYDFCPKCGSDNREVKNDKRRIRKSNTAF